MSFRTSEGSGGISHGYDRYLNNNIYLPLTHFSLVRTYWVMCSRDIRHNIPYFVLYMSVREQSEIEIITSKQES